MRQFLFLFLLLSPVLPVASQIHLPKVEVADPVTYIYSISQAEADSIYKNSIKSVNDSFFHTMIDSVNGEEKELSPGHYLFIESFRGYHKVRIETRTSFYPMVLYKPGAYHILVFDRNGEAVKDAEILQGANKFIYDSIKQAYVSEGKKDADIPLRISHRGEIAYYNISEWTGFFFDEGKGRKKKRMRRPTKSYLVFNKPRYLPDDTIKLKAYLLKNGKEYKGKVDLWLICRTNSGWQKSKLADNILPEKGAVSYQFLLADSLQLDKSYAVSVSSAGRKGKVLSFRTFYLEEYELDELTADVNASKETFYPGDSVVFVASVFDRNGNAGAEARLEVEVLTNEIYEFFESPSYVPFKIWEITLPSAVSGETRIVLPDTLIPSVDAEYIAKVKIINSSNEILERETSFTVLRGPVFLTTGMIDNIVFADLKGNMLTDREGELFIVKYNDTLEQRKIIFPFREKANPLATAYVFRNGDITAEVEMSSDFEPVSWTSKITNDSVGFSVLNYLDVPLHFTVERDGYILKEGVDTAPSFTIADKSDNRYHVFLNYLWGGRVKDLNFCVSRDLESLKVEMLQMARIEPGAEDKIQVLVKDQTGFPVPGVNLTAGSINAKFGNVELPSEFFRPDPDCGVFDTEFISVQKQQINELYLYGNKKGISKEDTTSLAWKLRYPMRRFEVYESTGNDRAEFVPYVVYEGREVFIFYGEIDDRPYFYNGIRIKNQYLLKPGQEDVFYAEPGLHKLRLITSHGEIHIDSVFLQSGKKLLVSVAATHPPVKNQKLDKNLRSRLEQSLKVVKTKKMGDMVIETGFCRQVISDTRNMLCGPFKGDSLTVLLIDSSFKIKTVAGKNILLEKDSLYQESSKKIKFHALTLYQDDIHWHGGNEIESILTSLPLPQDKYYELGSGKSEDNRGIYFHDNPNNLRFIAIAFISRDTIIVKGWDGKPIYDINPGTFSLAFITDSSRVYQAGAVEIRAGHFLLDKQTLQLVKENDTYWSNIFNSYGETVKKGRAYNIDIGRISGKYLYYSSDDIIFYPEQLYLKRRPVPLLRRIPCPSFFVRKPPVRTPRYRHEGGYLSGVSGRDEYRGPGLNSTATGLAYNEPFHLGQADEDIVTSRFEAGNASVPVWDLNPVYLDGNEPSALRARISNQPSYQWTLEENANGSYVVKLGELKGLRADFKDYGYWVPNLITDENGQASFQVRYPDDITGWNAYVMAMDVKGRTGYQQKLVKSFKEVSATLAVPRFLIAGDSSEVIGKIVNYSDSARIITSVYNAGNTFKQTAPELVQESKLDKFKLFGLGQDTVLVTYAISGSGISDGEQRIIPVLKQGALEKKGSFLVVENDTVIVINPDTSNGPVHLSLKNNTLDIMLDEIEEIKKYPYYCMEQTASKLLALLQEKKIRLQLSESFKGEREIRKLIKKLEEGQNTHGAWSWWGGSEGSSDTLFTGWITQVLNQADKMGYKSDALDRATRSLERSFVNSLKNGDYRDKMWYLLYVLAEANEGAKDKRILNYVDSMPVPRNTLNELYKFRVLQTLNQDFSVEKIRSLAKETITGSLYWGEENYSLFNNSIQATLIAYQILKVHEGYEKELARIRQYFLEARRGGSWRNTFESSSILATILPDIKSEEAPVNVTVTSGGGVEMEIKNFPFRLSVSEKESISVKFKGGQPVFFNFWQESWNANPVAVDSLFSISATYVKDNEEVKSLKAGEPVIMKVQVEVKAKADHVMLEVPIPAGCSYHSGGSKSRFEVHRENHKEKAVLFFDFLKAGIYTFDVSLQPRFQGNYTLNSVKAELMYFPTFSGRSGIRKLQIEE